MRFDHPNPQIRDSYMLETLKPKALQLQSPADGPQAASSLFRVCGLKVWGVGFALEASG